MIKKLPILFIISLIGFSFVSCKSTPNVNGKWSTTFPDEVKGLGKVEKEFILNVRADNKYSITTRGTLLANNVSKIFSQETGGWYIQSDVMTFIPAICMEMDETYQLVDMKCPKERTDNLKIEKGKWSYGTPQGKTLLLTKKE